MAPRAVLLCLLAAAAPLALGKVIKVELAEDGSGFNSCPGPTCNLRQAWRTSALGDTILLEVDPIMDVHLGALTGPPWDGATENGTVTIMGPPGRGAVVHGGSRFLSVGSFPYRPGVYVGLKLENIEFSGFRTKDGKAGMVICIATDSSFCTDPSQSKFASAPSSRHSPESRARTHGAGVLVGEEQTQFGNWSDLRKRPMLEITNCVFRNNSYYAPRGSHYGSVISTQPQSSNSGEPILITSSQFMNNSITGYQSSIGTVIGAEGVLDSGTPLMISQCRFAGNNQETVNNDRIEGFQGPLIGNFGPISIYGSNFVGNTVGSSRSVVSTGTLSSYQYHVYIYDSNFIDNQANSQESNSKAATIVGGWIILHRVTAILPKSVPSTATLSTNDQYMHECAIRSDTGKATEIRGYQMYNRNPTYTNLMNGTSSNGDGFGFADCTQAAAWLPCRAGTTCTTVESPIDEVVGYTCS